MIVLNIVDQRETALASTASATRTMKKQPYPMLYLMKPVLPSVPEPTGNTTSQAHGGHELKSAPSSNPWVRGIFALLSDGEKCEKPT